MGNERVVRRVRMVWNCAKVLIQSSFEHIQARLLELSQVRWKLVIEQGFLVKKAGGAGFAYPTRCGKWGADFGMICVFLLGPYIISKPGFGTILVTIL